MQRYVRPLVDTGTFFALAWGVYILLIATAYSVSDTKIVLAKFIVPIILFYYIYEGIRRYRGLRKSGKKILEEEHISDDTWNTFIGLGPSSVILGSVFSPPSKNKLLKILLSYFGWSTLGNIGRKPPIKKAPDSINKSVSQLFEISWRIANLLLPIAMIFLICGLAYVMWLIL
jgi:hypothetical protein